MMRVRLVATLALFLLATCLTGAPPRTRTYRRQGAIPRSEIPLPQLPLRDDARLLDSSTAAAVRKICSDLQKDTRAELAVLIISSTHGKNHYDFAMRTFNKWGIGRRGIDDGMLIMFAIDDRRVEIIPGTRYKQLFDAPTATALLTSHVVPLMRAGKPRDGVLAAAQAVSDRVRTFEKSGGKVIPRGPSSRQGAAASPHRSSSPTGQPSLRPPWVTQTGRLLFYGLLAAWLGFGLLYFYQAFIQGKLLLPTLPAGLCMAAGGGLLAFLGYHFLNPALYSLDLYGVRGGGIGLLGFIFCGQHICPRCNRMMSTHSRTLRAATYTSSGLGETTEHCNHCRHHRVYTYTISRRTRSSSSGSRSSGGGGGRSSGGGGGASW